MANNDAQSSGANLNGGSRSHVSKTESRPDTIKQALKTLDDAIQSDGASLKELVGEEYAHLRDAISEVAPKVSENLRKLGGQAFNQASQYASQGAQKGRQLAADVDGRVRENPWAVIGGVAVSALTVGFLLGRSRD